MSAYRLASGIESAIGPISATSRYYEAGQRSELSTLPSPSPKGLSSGGNWSGMGAYRTNTDGSFDELFAVGPGSELSKRLNARPAEGLIAPD